MSNQVMVCSAVHRDGMIAVLSPSIGRLVLTARPGQVMSPGQHVGELWRLNRRFILQLPDGAHGHINDVKSMDRFTPVQYGQIILHLQEAPPNRVDVLRKHETKQAGFSIDSPMDGMFYLSSSPNDPPFVSVGDVLKPGQTIGLIEVMKCFYPIKFQGQKEAKITEINVKNATPVSTGTRLLQYANPE